MSMTMFKEVSYTLAKLLADIEMGEIGLPEIQRPFVWPNTKVRDLFDSMYKGFPVGYLLFWANGAGDGHRQIGSEEKQKAPHLLIVDGQQRLTSLYAVIKGISVMRTDYRHERIQIAFNPVTEKFEVADAAIKRDPAFITDISAIWSENTDIFELAEEYLTRLRLSREVNSEEQKAIRKAINNLDNIQTFPFTALEISGSANEEQVAEIFVRVNSKGTPLNRADFILTLMSVFWETGRTNLEHFCRDSRHPSPSGSSPFNYFIHPDPDQLLRVEVGLGFRRAQLQHVYNILRGKDLETGEFSDQRREHQFSILQQAQAYALQLQNWHDFHKSLLRAGYRGADMISSQSVLLYSYVFYLIGKRDYGLDEHSLRNIIARWFYMSALTGRYSGSSESTMEQDLSRLREAPDGKSFIAQLDKTIDEILTDDYWSITLPNELDTSSARSPSLFSYYAALNLLNASVLFSQMRVPELLDPAIKANKSAMERHHLFPKGYLKTIELVDIRITNQIANYALVEWTDNIEISDKAPTSYVPNYEARFSPDDIKKMYYWHALPEGWHKMEFSEFLEQRRRMIAKIIHDGFEKLK
jgi:hypothetical protein